jgi:hypothetical protein
VALPFCNPDLSGSDKTFFSGTSALNGSSLARLDPSIYLGTHQASRASSLRALRRTCNTEKIMKPIKSVLAGLAGAGLLLSQPAAAATRAASDVRDSEQLAGFPSAALPALIAILAVGIVAVVSSSNDDNDNPVSP